jgi:hypothetical protein
MYKEKAEPHWKYESTFYDVRKAKFPHEALGELWGWYEVRKDLGAVLYDHGYMWSDLLYSYMDTEDLAHPVRWEDV